MMILILASTLCLLITSTRTQSQFLSGDRMTPYHDERQMEMNYLIKVQNVCRIKILLELIIVVSLSIKYLECVEVLAQVEDSTEEQAKGSRGEKKYL